jgi:RHS repeat-associated protein
MFGGKQFDMVLGVDIHLIQLPAPGPPVPIPHPFFGIIFDPLSFTPPPPPAPPAPPQSLADEAKDMLVNAAKSALIGEAVGLLGKFGGPLMTLKALWDGCGATVYINGLPHGNVGAAIKGIPFHFPIGGTFVKPIGNKGEIFMGSHSVGTAGAPLSRLGDIALSCQCIGPPDGLPFSMILAIPMGRPVLVGGFPTLDFKALVQKALNAAAGKLAAKAKAAASPAIHAAAGGIAGAMGFPKGSAGRDALHAGVCSWTGHPVDIAAGKVMTNTIDFEFVGVIPLKWERVWYSTSQNQGYLGHGWHHSYDISLGLDAAAKGAALRLADGRVEPMPFLEKDGVFICKKEKIRFFRKNNQFGYFDLSSGWTYWFSEQPIGKDGFYRLVKIENAYLHAIQLQYDKRGDLVQITDTAQRILTITNDSNHRIRKVETMHPIENQLFSLVEYDYDAIGNLIQSRNALAQPMTYRYEKHLLVQETDANGLSFYFKYDGVDSEARCIQTWGTKGIYNHQLKYDLNNKCTTVLNSLGYETKHYYNDLGAVTKKVNSDGSFTLKHYSDDAELLFETDELGRVTRYAYDDFANVIAETRPDGIVLKSQYESGLLTQFQDAMGGKWAYQYNAKRQMIQRKDPLNRVTQYQFHPVSGLLETIIDPIGQKTGFEYDDFNNLSKVILPDKTTASWAYDALGRVIQTADVKGNQQNIDYDLISNIRKIEHPDGNIRYLDYDAMSNLTRARDRQQDIQFSYSGFNKLASRTQAGTRVAFHYDTEEQLTGIQNEHGFVYRFELDNRGNVVTEIGFDGVTRNYKRDVAGQIIEIRRGVPSRMLFQKNVVLSSKYEYNKIGQVIDIQHNDGTSEQYDYRADGALMMAKNLHATVRFERDLLGKILKEFQNEDWVSSEYNLLGNRIGLESSLGAKMVFGRNDMGDIMNMSANGLTEKWEASFQRDLAGLEIQREMTGGVTSGWKRDALGRPLEQETHAGGSLKRHKKYDWDVNDRLKSIRDLVKGDNNSVKFGHDAFGNLAWAEYGAGQFEYRMPDAVGNLFKTKSRTDRKYGPAGQLLVADGTHFEYDIEGNLIRKTESNGNLWRYDWNAAGFLAHVLRPDGTFVSFTYDALGRRLSKTHLDKTTCWIWDGNVPLHEWEQAADYYPEEVPELVGKAFNNLTTWVFEPESFIPIAKLTDFGRYSIVTDHLGTPATMFDDAGKEIWSVDLNTYGAVRRSLGETNDCPFRYQGQYEDVETGLYYNRFRYYDPILGQYVSADPIGVHGGLKLYKYVKDSNSWIDVFGLIPVYRLLRADEDPNQGLSAKKPGRDMTVHGHVSSGSRNNGSQFISTSTDPAALEPHRAPGQRMVSFDTDHVVADSRGNRNIIDISSVDKARANGVGAVSANMAAASKEVLVEGHVPADKIKQCA